MLLYRHSAGDNSYIIFFLVFVIGALVYSWFYSRSAIIRRKLKKAPGRHIADCLEGETARVKGVVQYAGNTLTAPLSKRKCAYYYVIVEEAGSKGSWHERIREEKAADIVLRDGNSYAYIDKKMLQSYVVDDYKMESGTWNDPTPQLEAYLKDHDQKSTGLLGFNRSLRYKEGVLEQGEIVAVAGKVSWKRKAELKLDLPVERVLVVGPTDDQEPVYLTDNLSIIGQLKDEPTVL